MRSNVQLWDRETAAEYLGCSPLTVYNYIQGKKLTSIKVRGKLFVHNDSLEALKRSLNGRGIHPGRPRKEKV